MSDVNYNFDVDAICPECSSVIIIKIDNYILQCFCCKKRWKAEDERGEELPPLFDDINIGWDWQ